MMGKFQIQIWICWTILRIQFWLDHGSFLVPKHAVELLRTAIRNFNQFELGDKEDSEMCADKQDIRWSGSLMVQSSTTFLEFTSC